MARGISGRALVSTRFWSALSLTAAMGQVVIDALEDRGFFLVAKRGEVRFAALHEARRTTDLVILDWLYDAAPPVPLGRRPMLSYL
jgi:hypothetical protein